MTIFSRLFWSYAGERAVKTVAQAAISLLTVAGVSGVLDVAWIAVLSAIALSGIISVLTSIVSYRGIENGEVVYELPEGHRFD